MKTLQPLLNRGATLFATLLILVTASAQIINIQPAYADTDTGGYPWNPGAQPTGAYDMFGYTTCPSNDTNCMHQTSNGYGISDPWTYWLRQCTSYAAWKTVLQFGVTFPTNLGDASTWVTNAQNDNFGTVYSSSGYTPQVGDIAVWTSADHVAYVFAVNSGIASLDEYNVGYDGNFYNTRTTASGSAGTPDHYIHVGTVRAMGARPAPIQFGGSMYVFKLNSTNTPVYDKWNGSTWSGWTSLGGTLAGDMVAINYGSEMDVYGVASNGQVVRNTTSNGSTWSNWSSLQGTMTGRPAAIQYQSNEMDVYARNPNDNKIYKDTTWNGSTWTGWGVLDNNTQSLSNPAVVQFGSTEMDVYIRSTDDAIYKDTWNGSTWGGFSSLGDNMSGDPTAIQYSSGEMDVYATGEDGQVYKDTWTTGWSHFNSLGGTMTGSTAVTLYGSTEMDVYARNVQDNHIYKDTWNGSGWSTFGSSPGLGGNESGDPAALQYGASEMDVYATNSVNNTDKDTWNGSSWGGFSSL